MSGIIPLLIATKIENKMNKQQPAVFLGRDGVLNKEQGHISQVDDFEFIEDVIEACKVIKQKGYQLVLVTNQPGIALGEFSEEQFHTLTEWMDWSLADRGVDLDGIYYCPHDAEEGKGEFKIDCECKKPKAGMLNEAIKDLNIDISRSLLVTDKLSGIKAGLAAGVESNYLVRSGKPIDEEMEQVATAIFDDLMAIANSL